MSGTLRRMIVTFAFVFVAAAMPGAEARAERKGDRTMQKATGTFEVKMTPQAGEEKTAGATLARMALDKQFSGDLKGEGKGEMLTAVSETPGSAVYVALERVSGTLHGRSGTFVLAHHGTMSRGEQSLVIHVVPDSATGELAGLSGQMTISRDEGRHAYELEFSLPEDE